MNDLFARTLRTRPLKVGLGCALLATLFAGAPAFAQTPAPAAEPAPAPAPAPEVVAPPPPAPPAAAPPPAPPAPPASEFPPISIGIWTRSAVAIQGTDPKKLNDIGYEQNIGEVNFSGQIHKNARVATNIIANGLNGTFSILDAWVGLDFVDEAHFWFGQLLIPVDRANKAGPFFSIPWNFAPGGYTVGATALNVGPVRGRGTGGVLWGDLMGGKFKYLLGTFIDSVANLATHPLYSGRLTYSLIGQEKPGFGQSATFYGTADSDVLSLSVGGQYRKDGSVAPAPAGGTAPAPDNYAEFNADLFGEFKLGGAGAFLTAEADYWHYDGDNQPAKDQFSVMGAYATSPVLGPVALQPMLRYQFASGDNSATAAAIDAQLGFLVKQQRLRFIANYQYIKLKNYAVADVTGNKVQLAVQAMFY